MVVGCDLVVVGVALGGMLCFLVLEEEDESAMEARGRVDEEEKKL